MCKHFGIHCAIPLHISSYSVVEYHHLEQQHGAMGMQERSLVSLPSFRSSGMTTLKVLKRFEFEASLMRSGVIAVDSAKPGSPALLFVRGAPTKVQGLVSGDSLPPDFHQVLLQQSSSPAEHGAIHMP